MKNYRSSRCTEKGFFFFPLMAYQLSTTHAVDPEMYVALFRQGRGQAGHLARDEDELLLLVDDGVDGHAREARLYVLWVVRHIRHRLRPLRRRRPLLRLRRLGELLRRLWLLLLLPLVSAVPERYGLHSDRARLRVWGLRECIDIIVASCAVCLL